MKWVQTSKDKNRYGRDGKCRYHLVLFQETEGKEIQTRKMISSKRTGTLCTKLSFQETERKLEKITSRIAGRLGLKGKGKHEGNLDAIFEQNNRKASIQSVQNHHLIKANQHFLITHQTNMIQVFEGVTRGTAGITQLMQDVCFSI